MNRHCKNFMLLSNGPYEALKDIEYHLWSIQMASESEIASICTVDYI